VGCSFDAEKLFVVLERVNTIVVNSPDTSNTLVMGPWLHGGWSRGDGDSLGYVKFNDKTSVYYRERIEFPFFEYHLKGKGEFQRAKARVFETGTNQWHTHEAWPPKGFEPKSFYLRAAGKLDFEPEMASSDSYDEYVSDPAKPVPFIDKIAIGM